MLVSFFTDIEGSTQLWEEQTAEMVAVIARHDAILQLCGILLCILVCVGGCGSRNLKPVGRITVVSSEMSVDAEGYTQTIAHIRNETNQKALGNKVLADCYQGDEVVATASQTAKPYDMMPDEEQFVTVRFDQGVECDLIRVEVSVRRWL